MRIEVTAPGAATVRLVPPDVAPFTVGSVSRVVDTTSRRGWQRHEWRYVLSQPPGARGRYVFEPFAVFAQGRTLRPVTVESRAWTLVVRDSAPAAVAGAPRVALPTPSGAAPASGPPPAGVTFTARILQDTVYVGQQATYELTVAVGAEARSRIRRNPEFVPPELRGVLAVDLPAAHRSDASGDAHVYRRALFPVAPGTVRVPSARLAYALALGTSYFSREERVSVRSNPVRVVAVAPPAAGRPAGWDGAVGTLHATARAEATSVRAGDAVEYTVRVEGTGNLALLPRPAVRMGWADAVAAGERLTVDSTSGVVRGAKEFVWLLTPRAAGRYEAPAVSYPYFDPAERRYDVAAAPAVPIEVTASQAASTAGSVDRPDEVRLSIRRTWRGEISPPLTDQPLFWTLLGLVPAPAALVLATRRYAARPRSATARARAKGEARDVGALAIRRELDRTLAARLGFRPSDAGAGHALVTALRRCGVTTPTAERAAALTAALDALAFGAGSGPEERGIRERGGDHIALAGEADAVRAAIDQEARPRSVLTAARHAASHRLSALICAGVAATLGTVACARAVADDRAADAFRRGVAHYDGGRTAAARQAFADAAARAPRAAEAWANAGTTAWVAGDTVSAAVAWQRARRLEPHASDLRAWVALLPATQDGGVSGVLPVPPNAFAVAASVLGVLGAVVGLVAARGPQRRAGRAGSPRVPLALWGAAIAAASTGAVLQFKARPNALAVVSRAGALREEPALDAEPGPPADVTDVARVVARTGSWAQVRLDGGREGWIDAGRLVPLVPAVPTLGRP